jgi:zinc protease
MSSRKCLVSLLVAFACGGGSKQSSVTPPAPPPVTPPPVATTPVVTTTASGLLATDPAVITGKLANGLTYYIRKNGKPEKRAELWLAVNAGSVLEDDDQRGVAHFVEHMAFNGTKKYPKAEIVSWLEKTGMKFGADVNARTTFDDTVYQLEVPTDKPEFVEHGLDILHEWAGSVSFDPVEVDKERGVVNEERRLSRGFQGRLIDKLIPAALPGSKYGARLPIGLEDIIKTATPETLKRFYQTWYRPDLMAVIVVGDLDPAALEAQVKAKFGDLVAPSPAVPRPQPDVPSQAKTTTLVLQDPEMPFTAVAIASKSPRRVTQREDDLRARLADELFTEMVNQRLAEIAKQATSPFIGAAVGKQSILRPIDVWFQGALVKGDRAAEALGVVASELARVAHSGFVETELARGKQSLLHRIEVKANERDKTESREYVEDLVKNFLGGDAVTSIDADLALAKKFLPGITTADLEAVAGRASSEQNRLVLAAGNSKTTMPDEALLTKTIATAHAAVGTAYVDDVAAGPLVPTPPTPGTIKSEKVLAGIGVTEWTLSNGVRVVMKPTDFQNDHVVFAGYSLGGTSLAKDADYVAAVNAAQIVDASGAGTLSATQLQKALSGTGVDVDVRIGDLDQVIFGGAQPDHIEQLLQLTYLRLAAARQDDKAVDAWRDQQVSARKNQLDDPGTVFEAKFEDISLGHHPRARLLSSDDYAKVDVARARSFYTERFAPNALTFVLVGSFAPDKIKPFVLTYLGGLPVTGKPASWRDIKVARPKGAVTFEVKQGLEPKATVKLLYHVATPWSRQADFDLAALADALSIRLREELREDKSGTYGVRVRGAFDREPHSLATVAISFGCAPENVDSLVKAMFAIIAGFQKDGPPAVVIDKIKETDRRENETSLKQNGFWLESLLTSYRQKDDPGHVLTDAAMIDKLTVGAVRDAAKRFLGKDHVLGVLRPAN